MDKSTKHLPRESLGDSYNSVLVVKACTNFSYIFLYGGIIFQLRGVLLNCADNTTYAWLGKIPHK